MPLEIQMNWDEWKDKYQPLMVDATMDDGDLMEFERGTDAAEWIRENWKNITEEDLHMHVWTETAGDAWTYVSTGFHVCDRMHLFVCEVPWTNLYEACVYEDRGTYCEYCDEEVHSCIHDDDEWQDKADILAEEQANE